MTKEDIINKINKIRALAEHGEGGEKISAESLLNLLMQKYGITEEDLYDEKEQVYFLKVSGYKCRDLFQQVAIIYCNVDRMTYFGKDAQDKYAKKIRNITDHSRPRGSNMAILCTPSKYIELKYAYEMFQKSFDRHVEGLFYGFLATNNLLAPYNPDNPKSDMDDETIDIASRMGLAVKRTEINKALPQNKLPE